MTDLEVAPSNSGAPFKKKKKKIWKEVARTLIWAVYLKEQKDQSFYSLLVFETNFEILPTFFLPPLYRKFPGVINYACSRCVGKAIAPPALPTTSFRSSITRLRTYPPALMIKVLIIKAYDDTI